jgi:multicomponent Na+:H+ antiporter subunit D
MLAVLPLVLALLAAPASLLQVYQRRFMRPGSEGSEPSPRASRFLVVALVALVVLLGLWPEPLVYVSEAAAAVLVGGS